MRGTADIAGYFAYRGCGQVPAPRARETTCGSRQNIVGVGHKQADELDLVVALDELDASCARDDAQLVEPAGRSFTLWP